MTQQMSHRPPTTSSQRRGVQISHHAAVVVFPQDECPKDFSVHEQTVEETVLSNVDIEKKINRRKHYEACKKKEKIEADRRKQKEAIMNAIDWVSIGVLAVGSVVVFLLGHWGYI
ncbi:hypothetical protein BDV96DRAFT_602062 [Lophiotrema nucula]|uniref:Transmembrane protein n=1 Tax=Lophiotrema nucula TaxID=690887 RepID=A0A6A5Z0R1_9PLEO|nr:hypothetical protein BDV96DRAFT_602062 [Lophiotrema nucula]